MSGTDHAPCNGRKSSSDNNIRLELELPLNETNPINIPFKSNHYKYDPISPSTPNIPNTPPPTPELSSIPPPPPAPSNGPQNPVPPKWLTSAFIETALRKKHPDIQVTNLHLVPAVATGENYMSLAFRADVGTTQGPFGLIIKCKPESEFRVKMMDTCQVTTREYTFYDRLLPIIQEGVQDNSHKPMTPPCYYSIQEGPKDAIVLQDLRPYGFRTADRKIGLDKNHCERALIEVAKLHALSIKLRIEKPELFQTEIVEKFSENMYCEEARDIFTPFLKNSQETLAKGIIEKFPYRYHNVAKIIDKTKETIFDLMLEMFRFNPNRILVLNHGDFWTNNFLFQYETKEDINPLACCLLDFQIAKCGPPTLDLQYFLYTSTTRETRRAHLDELLQVYMDQVHKTLRELNVTVPANMFYNSIDEIKQEMEELALFGFISACLVMPVVVANSEDAPDLDSYTEESIQEDTEPFEKLFAGALFQQRFREVLDDVDDSGFFRRLKKVLEERNIM